MFETLEYYHLFNEKYHHDTTFRDKAIEQYRRMKKINFWMNTGLIKLSTIQSFKGWEIDTLFLIINSDLQKETPELIYTGLTRARNNLFIINLGNKNFENIFKNYKKIRNN